jgi:hypothetical protein
LKVHFKPATLRRACAMPTKQRQTAQRKKAAEAAEALEVERNNEYDLALAHALSASASEQQAEQAGGTDARLDDAEEDAGPRRAARAQGDGAAQDGTARGKKRRTVARSALLVGGEQRRTPIRCALAQPHARARHSRVSLPAVCCWRSY